jgi:hypothetical protein
MLIGDGFTELAAIKTATRETPGTHNSVLMIKLAQRTVLLTESPKMNGNLLMELRLRETPSNLAS